jgi:hypothetical protein
VRKIALITLATLTMTAQLSPLAAFASTAAHAQSLSEQQIQYAVERALNEQEVMNDPVARCAALRSAHAYFHLPAHVDGCPDLTPGKTDQ